MFLKTLFITCYQYLPLFMLLVLLVLIPNSYSFYLPLLYSVHIYYQHPLLVLTANIYCQHSLLVPTTKYALLVLTATLTASTYYKYSLLVLTTSTFYQYLVIVLASKNRNYFRRALPGLQVGAFRDHFPVAMHTVTSLSACSSQPSLHTYL